MPTVTVYCRKHLTVEYMFVIVSILPCETKAVLFCLQLNTISGRDQRTSMICKETRGQGLQFKGKPPAYKRQTRSHLQHATTDMTLCQNFLIGQSCCRHHKPQLGSVCIPNLACDYFNQLCSGNLQNRQSCKSCAKRKGSGYRYACGCCGSDWQPQ